MAKKWIKKAEDVKKVEDSTADSTPVEQKAAPSAKTMRAKLYGAKD